MILNETAYIEFQDVYKKVLDLRYQQTSIPSLVLNLFVTKYDLNKINQSIKADEFHIMTSTSGNKYVRIWWD